MSHSLTTEQCRALHLLANANEEGLPEHALLAVHHVNNSVLHSLIIRGYVNIRPHRHVAITAMGRAAIDVNGEDEEAS